MLGPTDYSIADKLQAPLVRLVRPASSADSATEAGYERLIVLHERQLDDAGAGQTRGVGQPSVMYRRQAEVRVLGGHRSGVTRSGERRYVW